MNPLYLLADAAENLYPARMQMALSLGWHIVFACFGIAFPLITVFTEWRGDKRGDAALTELAHTWAQRMGVPLAAAGAAGTPLSPGAATPGPRGGAGCSPRERCRARCSRSRWGSSGRG